jgi:hypothetical protein
MSEVELDLNGCRVQKRMYQINVRCGDAAQTEERETVDIWERFRPSSTMCLHNRSRRSTNEFGF